MKGKPHKTFSWRRPRPTGAWEYKMPDPCPLYRLPELLAARAAAGADPVTVWLVEGEKNADDLAAAGAVAVSAPNGAHFGWRDEYTGELAGADVVLVADRDAPGFARAEAVRTDLAAAGVAVRVVCTPVDRDHADASDHLAAGLGLDAFIPVADAAAATAAAPAPAGGADAEVVAFPGGSATDRPERERRPGRGGDAAGDGRRGRRIVRETFAVLDDEDGDEGGVFHIRTRASCEEVATELLNCQMKITRRIAVDPGDGSDTESGLTTTHVDVRAKWRGEVIELRRVPWDEFRRCEYLLRLPWPLAWNDTPSGRSKLMNAIVTTSGPVPVTPAYATLGWRQIGGVWTYVHAAGGITAAGAVPGIEVDVSPRLRNFTLPAPPSGPDELRAALRGVLEVLDALPARISAPTMGAALRAVLGETRASVFVVGHTGSRKSGLAALAQQAFMPSARHNRLPVGAGEAASTATGMEELLWQAGDALVVADDLAPDRGAERSAMRANELLRAVGNGSPKLRGARAGGLREDRPPRGLLMLTGEDGASKPSAESRTVYVPLEPGDVRLDVIRDQLSPRSLIKARNATCAALVQYVASRMPIAEWVDDQRDAFTLALLAARGIDPDADPSGLTSRRAEAVADLALGWRALLDAAIAGGALDVGAADEVWSRVWAGLAECLAVQDEVADRRSLVDRAADLLRSAVLAGRAHLASHEGSAPSGDRLRACGWTKSEGAFGDVRPGGDVVGWLSRDGRSVWLNPGSAFAAMERQGKSESDPLGVTARALVKALVAAKVITTERAKGRTKPVPQVRRPILGVRDRVWELPWSWLWPDDVEPSPGGAGGDGPAGGDPVDGPDSGPSPAVEVRAVHPGEADPAVQHVAPARHAAPAGTPGPVPSPAGKVATTSETSAESLAEPFPGLPPTANPPAPATPVTEPLRAREDGERYRALGVVVDVDAAHLIGGGSVEVPVGLDSIPAIVEWAQGLRLGVEHSASRDDAGQVWVMPELARRCGLHKRPTATSGRATTTHPAVKALTTAGWSVGHRGLQPWTNVWRPGEAGLYLVIVPWLTEDVICKPSAPPAVDVLAERLDMYASFVLSPRGERQPYLFSAATTGTTLLKLCRATATTGSIKVKELPPPAIEGDGRRWEPEWACQRGPTPAERRAAYVVSWDVNAQYLASAAIADLGLGEAKRVDQAALPRLGPLGALQQPAKSVKLPPGYWLVRRPDPAPGGMPDLCDPTGSERDRDIWITTPTLVAARQHGVDLRPREAWLWEQSTVWLQSWAHALRDGRYVVDGAREVHPDDEDLEIIRRAVKLTYAAGIGMLGSSKYRGDSDHYRPDARHHVIALAKANLWRKCAKAAAAGWAPLGIHRDAVLFASDSNDPEQAPPPGFSLGTKLGQVKWNGYAPMSDMADALAASVSPSEETFGILHM